MTEFFRPLPHATDAVLGNPHQSHDSCAARSSCSALSARASKALNQDQCGVCTELAISFAARICLPRAATSMFYLMVS
jgi:hypothetical protein